MMNSHAGNPVDGRFQRLQNISQEYIYIYVINSKHSIFMKHFTSSTSVVVEVPAQQYLFVHFVFLHKTKVNGLQHRDELNTSTNSTPFLQYSSGGERRGVTLRLCLSGSRFSSGVFVCVCVGNTAICQ